MWMIALLAPAWADFYHPSDVASASALYQEASSRTADAAQAKVADSRALSSSLAAFEEAVDLLGEAATPEHTDRVQGLRKQYNRDFATLQAFADAMVADFDGAFVAALERAAAAHPGAERCERSTSVGPMIPGMAQRSKVNPDCKGADLNAAMAQQMDADPQLKADLAAVFARQWPGLTVAPVPVAPVGGARTVQVADFFRAAMPDTLRGIRQADEDARLEFAVAIEGGADAATLKGLVDKAKAVDARTASQRAAAAAPVFEKTAGVFEKAATDAGWCVQPPLLGGCGGTDDSRALIDLLLADKRVLKALP